MSEVREAFLAKYALSDNGKVTATFVTRGDDSKYWFECGPNGEDKRFASIVVEKRDFAFTPLAAIELAEQLREKKRKSLEKQLAKLAKLKFEVVRDE
jgi:hypothetical protein